MPPEIVAHYALGLESARLATDVGPLERARTEEILARVVPAAPARIADVGGAAGAYALALAAKGFEVHLLDASPLHVEQARAASAAAKHPLASAAVGDARALPWPDGFADGVLLLGPLYHLPERADRVAALREARRVTRAGGFVAAAAITRFASLFEGLVRGALADAAFDAIVRRDLATGRHVNDTGRAEYFTTAFFHRPEELRAEIEDAGMRCEDLLAVEGPAAWAHDFAAAWKDPEHRRRILDLVREIEREPALLAASPHVLAIARR